MFGDGMFGFMGSRATGLDSKLALDLFSRTFPTRSGLSQSGNIQRYGPSPVVLASLFRLWDRVSDQSRDSWGNNGKGRIADTKMAKAETHYHLTDR
jgi:hypothetical protein